MNCLLFSYEGSSRELKKIIISLLKSWCASKVHKFNYVQSFWFNGNVVEKSEIKYMIIYTSDEPKLLNFLSKNFPQVEKVEFK
jgi:predicted DNA binding protein